MVSKSTFCKRFYRISVAGKKFYTDACTFNTKEGTVFLGDGDLSSHVF